MNRTGVPGPGGDGYAASAVAFESSAFRSRCVSRGKDAGPSSRRSPVRARHALRRRHRITAVHRVLSPEGGVRHPVAVPPTSGRGTMRPPAKRKTPVRPRAGRPCHRGPTAGQRRAEAQVRVRLPSAAPPTPASFIGQDVCLPSRRGGFDPRCRLPGHKTRPPPLQRDSRACTPAGSGQHRQAAPRRRRQRPDPARTQVGPGQHRASAPRPCSSVGRALV